MTNNFKFPIIRRVFPTTIASQIVSVQPMTLPKGLMFYNETSFYEIPSFYIYNLKHEIKPGSYFSLEEDQIMSAPLIEMKNDVFKFSGEFKSPTKNSFLFFIKKTKLKINTKKPQCYYIFSDNKGFIFAYKKMKQLNKEQIYSNFFILKEVKFNEC